MGNNQSIQDRKRTKELKRLQTKRLMASELLVHHMKHDDADVMAHTAPKSTSHDSPFQHGSFMSTMTQSQTELDSERATTEMRTRRQKVRRSLPVGRPSDYSYTRRPRPNSTYDDARYTPVSPSKWIFEQQRREEAAAAAAASPEIHKLYEQAVDDCSGHLPNEILADPTMSKVVGRRSYSSSHVAPSAQQVKADFLMQRNQDITSLVPTTDDYDPPIPAPSAVPLPSTVHAAFITSSASSAAFNRPDFRVSAQPRHESIDEIPELEGRKSGDTVRGACEMDENDTTPTTSLGPTRSSSIPHWSQKPSKKRPPLIRHMSDEDAASIGTLLAQSRYNKASTGRQRARPKSMLATIPSRGELTVCETVGEPKKPAIETRRSQAASPVFHNPHEAKEEQSGIDRSGDRALRLASQTITGAAASEPRSAKLEKHLSFAAADSTASKGSTHAESTSQNSAIGGNATGGIVITEAADEAHEHTSGTEGHAAAQKVVMANHQNLSRFRHLLRTDTAGPTASEGAKTAAVQKGAIITPQHVSRFQHKLRIDTAPPEASTLQHSFASAANKQLRMPPPVSKRPSKHKSKVPRVTSSTQTSSFDIVEGQSSQLERFSLLSPTRTSPDKSAMSLEKRDSKRSSDGSSRSLYGYLRTRIFDHAPTKSSVYVKGKDNKHTRINGTSQVSLTASPSPASTVSMADMEQSLRSYQPLNLVVTNNTSNDRVSSAATSQDALAGVMSAGEFRKRRSKQRSDDKTHSSSSSTPHQSARQSSAGYESDQTAVNAESPNKSIKEGKSVGSADITDTRSASVPLLEAVGAQEDNATSAVPHSSSSKTKISHRPIPALKLLLGKSAEAFTSPRFSSLFSQDILYGATSEVVAAATINRVDASTQPEASGSPHHIQAFVQSPSATNTSTDLDQTSHEQERRSRRLTSPSDSPAFVYGVSDEFNGTKSPSRESPLVLESLKIMQHSQSARTDINERARQSLRPSNGSLRRLPKAKRHSFPAGNRNRTLSLPPGRSSIPFGPRPLQNAERTVPLPNGHNQASQVACNANERKLIEIGIQAGSVAQSDAAQHSSDEAETEMSDGTARHGKERECSVRQKGIGRHSHETSLNAFSQPRQRKDSSPVSSVHSTDTSGATAPYPESAMQASLAALRALEKTQDSTTVASTHWAREKLLGYSSASVLEYSKAMQSTRPQTRSVLDPRNLIDGQRESQHVDHLAAKADSLSSMSMGYHSDDQDGAQNVESVGHTISAQESMLELLSVAAAADVMMWTPSNRRQFSQRDEGDTKQRPPKTEDDAGGSPPTSIPETPVSAADHLHKKSLKRQNKRLNGEDIVLHSPRVARISEGESDYETEEEAREIIMPRHPEKLKSRDRRPLQAVDSTKVNATNSSADPSRNRVVKRDVERQRPVRAFGRRSSLRRASRQGYSTGDIEQWQASMCQDSLVEASQQEMLLPRC